MLTVQRNTKAFAVLILVAATLACAADDFPKGSSTPEGAACDLARAFIQRDAALFEAAILQPFGGGESRSQYEAFLKDTKSAILEESKRPADRGPREIVKVFAARSLSRSGPASYAYATFNFADVKFVDVVVEMHGGGTNLNRTLVVKDGAGRWHVDPAPGIHPMLSAGLNDETTSTVDAKTPNKSLERTRDR
jgi:hypothetical protein